MTQNINISQIYYIEVINRKIYVHTQYDTIEYYDKLEQVQKQLDKRFIKCHRSYIINMDYFLPISKQYHYSSKWANSPCISIKTKRTT